MKKYFSTFRVLFTAVLCLIFAVLLFPLVLEKYGLITALLPAIFCILFIRGIYFIPA